MDAVDAPPRQAPVVYEGFAVQADVDALLGLGGKVFDPGIVPEDPWARHEGPITTVYEQHLRAHATPYEAQVLDSMTIRACLAIEQAWGGRVVPECVLMVRMAEGGLIGAHADAELEDGRPNHTPQRSHVALLYLTDCDGGRLRTWDALRDDGAFDVLPYPGRMVCFPSTRRYMHDVSPVNHGERWNLAVWTKLA